MNLLQRINGIIGNLFQLGSGGPQIKNNSGAIEVRNSTDTGFSVMRAAIPVGLNDLVPKSYADLVAHVPKLDSPQYPGLFTSHISTLRGPTLPHGGGYTVIDMDGAGYLSKIFCTLANYTGAAPSLKFQVFVDGELTPSIDVFVEDMCCFRSGVCSSDRAGGGIGSNGLSFFFNFVAPFSSHLKVQFLDLINDGVDRLLGGYLEYKIGTGMNWGLYGKLWSSTMNYTVVPYATQTLLNVTSATGGVFVGGYYDLTGEADFHFLEGWLNAVIDGYGVDGYNWINGGGGQVQTSNYMFDSVEDFGEDGFYFSATGGAHNQTRNLGLTFLPSSGHVAWYKWHYENPLVFSSSLLWTFTNGFNGTFPTLSNTTIKGVIWYYTGAVGSVVSPTTIKGDQGVPGGVGTQGPQGIQGLPGGYVSPYSGRFVLVSRDSATATSHADGRGAYSSGGTITTGGWYGIAWDATHARFVTVSNGSNSAGKSAYSADGGASWTVAGTISASLTSFYLCLYDPVHFTLIAVAQGSTSGGFYSTTGGTSWVQSASVIISTSWFACCFDSGHSRGIWVSTATTDTMYTADGGVTFVAGGAGSIAAASVCYDPVHARVVSLPVSGTQSQYTTDGAATWVNGGVVPTGIYDVLVWDPVHAKLIGIPRSATQTVYSTDGGVTWANGGTITSSSGYRCGLYDPYTGRVLVQDVANSVVRYTEDGGATWQSLASLPFAPFLAEAYP